MYYESKLASQRLPTFNNHFVFVMHDEITLIMCMCGLYAAYNYSSLESQICKFILSI